MIRTTSLEVHPSSYETGESPDSVHTFKPINYIRLSVVIKKSPNQCQDFNGVLINIDGYRLGSTLNRG